MLKLKECCCDFYFFFSPYLRCLLELRQAERLYQNEGRRALAVVFLKVRNHSKEVL